MKNIITKKLFLLVVIVASFLSCDDDSLTEDNPNTISRAVFWKNLKDTNIGLASAYNALLDEDVLGVVPEGFRSDMGWPGFGRPVAGGDGQKIMYEHNYTNSNGFVEGKWAACYRAIFRANQVIEGLENIEGNMTEDDIEPWTLQMGQARFIRGMMHFYLHSSYNNGNIIIRDKAPKPTNPEDLSKPLSSSDTVKAFFRADLEYAYENLPEKYNKADENAGRASKGAAATLLGTSYLYEGTYDKAMIYFTDVIENVNANYGYKLVEDMNLLFTNAGEFNEESIFELNYTSDYRTDIRVFRDNILSNQLAHITGGNLAPVVPAWLINKYKKDALDPNDERNLIDDPTSPTGKKLRPVSLRLSSMIAVVDDDVSVYIDEVTGAKIKLSNNGWGFGYYKKYTNHDLTSGTGDPRGSRSSGKNVTVNRLADVYLMQAECLIKTGDIPGALELINAVRHRWALVLLGSVNPKWPNATYDLEVYDETTLMERLMFVEKPLEMSLEGHQIRWIDLRRWGVTEQNFKKLADETYYASNFTGTKLDGTEYTKNGSSISDVDTNNATNLNIIDYEYDGAALNFNPERHSYYPIPLSEEMRNPFINP